MRTRNITPFVEYPLIAAWIVAVPVVATAVLPEIVAFLVGVALGVGGVHALMWLLRGDRIWITSHHTLPFTFMLKPRGFRASSGIGGVTGDGDDTVTCEGCGSDFEEVQDHFRSDSDNYCPDCSRVGELVMQNYQQWFDTTEDVQRAEASD